MTVKCSICHSPMYAGNICPNCSIDKAAKDKAERPSDATACSRFRAARVEELLQARDNIAEGDRDMVTHADACDLVNWYADELDRVRMHYQAKLSEIAIAALQGSLYPENDLGMAAGATVPPLKSD